MSGSANNLPVKLSLEGAEEFSRKLQEITNSLRLPVEAAQRMPEAVNRAGESFSGLQRRAQAAVGTIQDVRGAMELLGASGAAGGLGHAATAASTFAETLSMIAVAAGRIPTPIALGAAAVAGGVAAWSSYSNGVGGAANALTEFDRQAARTTSAVNSLNELLETSAERAARVTSEQRAQLALVFSADSRRLLEEIGKVERALELLQRDRARIIQENANAPGFNAATVLRDPIAQQTAELSRLRAEQRDAESGRERALTAPTGADRDRAAEEARKAAEERRKEAERRARDGEAADARSHQRVENIEHERLERERRAEEQARERREREQEQYLRRVEQANERTTDNIVRYAGDAFADMFSNTGGGFDQLMARMRQTALQTFARIAADAVIRPIVAPIVSELGLGGLGGGGGGGGGGLGSMLGLSNLLPTGGLVSGVNSYAAGLLPGVFSSGAAPALGAPMLGANGMLTGGGATSLAAPAGLTFSGALGAAGLGFMGGGMLASLTGGNQMGGSIGGGLGAAAGALLAPATFGISAVLGGILGGAGGGLLGGMFGGNADRPPFWGVNIGTDSSGRFTVGDAQGKRADQQMQAAVLQAQQETAALNQQLAALGLVASNGALIGSDPDDPTRSASVTGATAFRQFRFDSTNANVSAAIGGRAFSSPDELTSAASWVLNTYNALTDTAEPLGAFEAALKALNEQFDAAAIRARDLGLSEAALETARVRAIAAAESARRDAAAAGLTGPVGSLADFTRGLRTSNDNPLNPQARLELARSDLKAQFAAAATDPAALGRVQSSVQALLSTSRDVNGTGRAFAADFDTALGGLGGLSELGVDTLTSAVFSAETRTQTEILAAALARLGAEVQGLRREVQQQGANPLTARAA